MIIIIFNIQLHFSCRGDTVRYPLFKKGHYFLPKTCQHRKLQNIPTGNSEIFTTPTWESPASTEQSIAMVLGRMNRNNYHI